MSARISSDFFTGALNSVFTNTQNFVPSQVMCYRGSLTPNPTVTGVVQISASSNGGSALGTTSIGSNNASGYWTQPSNGVSILSSPINIYTGNSAIFGASPVAVDQHVIRLLRSPMPAVTITNAHGVLDLELGTVRSPQKAKVDKSTITYANNFAILEIGFKLLTRGNTSFNNALANSILKTLLISGNNTVNGNYGLFAGLPFIYDAGGSAISAPIVFSAYDGPVPLSANFEATGTKLWESIKMDSLSTMEEMIYTVTGNSFGLKNSHSGTILANGTPTYIRIRKECPVSLAGLYPAFEIQLPVGLDDNQASFNKTNFVAGQTASLNPFTISMLLQSGI